MGISETFREIQQGRIEREWNRNRPDKPKHVRLNEERDSRDWDIKDAEGTLATLEQLVGELGSRLPSIVPHLGLSNRLFCEATGLTMSRRDRELLQRCVTAGGIDACRKKTHEFIATKRSEPLKSEFDPDDSPDTVAAYNRWLNGASAAMNAVEDGEEDWTEEDDNELGELMQ